MGPIQSHGRRWAPFYAFGVFTLLLLALFPTTAPSSSLSAGFDGSSGSGFGGGGDSGFEGGGFTSDGTFDGGTFGSGEGSEAGSGSSLAGGAGGSAAIDPVIGRPAAGGGQGQSGTNGGGGTNAAGGSNTAGGASGGGGTGGGSSGGGNVPSLTGASGGVIGQGTTSGGFPCKPGVRQLPWSGYAPLCRSAFTGNNGGQTWRGVTADTIKVVVRNFADSADGQVNQQVNEEAGLGGGDGPSMRDVLMDYLAASMEVYGRTIVFEEFTSSSNPFEELNGRNVEQACADATEIAQEMNAFAVIPGGTVMSGPFAECAAKEGLLLPIGPYGFPEEFYEHPDMRPYLWNIQMSCNRISELQAEYIVKRVNGHKAIHAKDPLYRPQKRVIGAIGPNIDAYAECAAHFDRRMKAEGIKIESDFQYTLDPATLPAQMQQAVIRFKAAGVTTLILAADFLTLVNLTQAAEIQEWGPEWLMQGSGFQDLANYARLYSQDRVNGHMFGMSQLGQTEKLLTNGEAHETYRRAAGEDPSGNGNGGYFTLLFLYTLFQESGPILTPRNIEQGMFRNYPGGGPPTLDMGRWDFRQDYDGTTRPAGTTNIPGWQYTATVDTREVYWLDGKFIETYDGRRFGPGEWPREKPPVYPNQGR